MIRFEQVTRRYDADGRPALDDVTVEFYRGDFAFLIGASGSGKSTLLRMILREGLPQRGKVTVAGQNLGLMLDRRVPDFRRSIGMVFQDFRLLPDKTVFDNVAFAMRVLGAKRSAIRKRVTKVLEKVDLAHLAKRYPHEISGGEQQRAAIARAIVNGPAILLADEPTGNLDPRASAEVMKVLRWINASGTTVIMATHDRAIVDQAQSRVVQLHRGRLVRDEPHGFYDAPIGSEAWEVLAQEEGESGLRAHDPAPLKTGVVPIVAAAEPSYAPHADTEYFDDEDSETSDPYDSDLPADQSIEPGEDPSVVAYENDPVLQETGPEDFAHELEHMHFDAPVSEDEPLQEGYESLREEPAEEFTERDAAVNAENEAEDDAPDNVEDEAELEELEFENLEAADAEFEDPDSSEEEPLDLSAWDAESWDAEFENVDLQASNAHTEVSGSAEAEDAGDPDFEDLEESGDTEVEDSEDEDAEHGEQDDEEGAGFHVSWPEHVRDQAVERDVPELHGDFNGTELPDLELDGYAEVDELEFIPDEPQVSELPLDEQLADGIPVQEQLDQKSLAEVPLLDDSPTGKLPPVTPLPRRLPPIYPGPTPARLATTWITEMLKPPVTEVPKPVAVRPRLSWLAHAEDEDGHPQKHPAQSNRLASLFDSLSPESALPQTSAPPAVTFHEAARQVGQRDQSASSGSGLPESKSSPEADSADAPAARPVPRPKSSASQSTYTDARRTAEHLGISRSRRSILRRLRRDV